MNRLVVIALLALSACSADGMSRIGAGLTGFSQGMQPYSQPSYRPTPAGGLLTQPRPVTVYNTTTGAVRSCHTVGTQIYC